MNCKNCLSPNPVGVSHCQVCRMPGDFGRQATQVATVVEAKVVDCTNCSGHAPAQAANCPSCRWPLKVAKPKVSPHRKTEPGRSKLDLRRAM